MTLGRNPALVALDLAQRPAPELRRPRNHVSEVVPHRSPPDGSGTASSDSPNHGC